MGSLVSISSSSLLAKLENVVLVATVESSNSGQVIALPFCEMCDEWKAPRFGRSCC